MIPTSRHAQMIVDTVEGTYQNTLTIAQSVPEHNIYGLYRCIVENSLGIFNRTVVYSGKSTVIESTVL